MADTTDHRRPPELPFGNAPAGLCRMCGEPTIPGKNGRPRRWHARCLDLYLVASDPKCARIFLFRRDKGKCASCGKKADRLDDAWHVDHVRRLRDAPRDIRYWLPENIQILCIPCHVRKTTAEQRASLKGHDDECSPSDPTSERPAD